MALRDFEREYKTLTFERPGKEPFTLPLRGLSLADISPMMATRLDLIRSGYALFQAAQQEPERGPEMLETFMLDLVTQFPELTSEVISRAADEPGQEDFAARLPLSVQAEALSIISALTMTEAGGLGNLYAILASEVKRLNPTMMTSLVKLPGSQTTR